jgi:hypothetical protein
LRRVKRREQKEIEEALREAWGPAAPGEGIEAAALVLWRLLRTGAGEEALVERLASLELAPLGEPARLLSARALLRIGVKPRGVSGYRRSRQADACTLCAKHVSFCWGCTCGFRICQDCTEENRWGITCNNITWECPDCGQIRGF